MVCIEPLGSLEERQSKQPVRNAELPSGCRMFPEAKAVNRKIAGINNRTDDEATSSLDSITEKYIQDTLYSLMKNKTTIVIAHRLSTLSKMDRILVFDNGEIIEYGTHEQLLEKNGHYARMWHMQAGGFLPEKENKNENK